MLDPGVHASAQQRPAVSVPDRPLLRPGYRIVAAEDRLLLEHAQRVVVLEGRAATVLLPPLLPLLDGERDVDAIVAELGEGARVAVERALEVLAARDVVCEGPSLRGVPLPLRETAEALAAAGAARPADVAAALAAASVAVVGRSRTAVLVADLLRDSGIGARHVRRWRDARGTLVVAAPGPGEDGALARLNRRALRRGTTWLPLLPYDGRTAAVGPLVVPGETACHRCFLLRRAAAVDYGDDLPALERLLPTAPAPRPLERLLAELGCWQALRWLGLADPDLPGTLLALDPVDGPRIVRHRVLRLPRCPACSGAGTVAAPLPWHDLPVPGAERAA